MDSATTPTTDPRSLESLVTRALCHLQAQGYSRKSLWRYRTVWRQFIRFARKEDPRAVYSQELAERFINAWHQCQAHAVAGEGWRRHVAFCIKVLGDFHRYADIDRSCAAVQRLDIPQAMKKPLHNYAQYCRDRRHLRETTLTERMTVLARFMDFLVSRGVQDLSHMQPADLAAYVASRRRFRPKTVSRIVSNARQFLKYLFACGVLAQDLSQVLPRIRVPRDAKIPSTWNPDLVLKLLNVVDRSSPRGKRDYAILLLACRLGLRAGDIRTLRLDEINWDAATLDIMQSKTATALRLPLSEELGEALIDYLRFARPKTDCREVFLKLRPPFAPFSANTHLYHIVEHWRDMAGIRFRSPQHQGLHSLRHTLATQLLQQDTPFHVISGVLGHATTASTLIYAKADTEALRSAALDTEEVSHAG